MNGKTPIKNASVIDLFCGVGGLSYGLKEAGLRVHAGIDFDNTCEFAYTENVKSDFIYKDISHIHGNDLIKKYWDNQDTRILVGCAPCQPFSSAANTLREKDEAKWNLLKQFERLILETKPNIVSMENVPNLIKQDIFKSFVEFLRLEGYHISYEIVFCPNYGIPQNRKRLVLLGSRFGEINLIDKTHNKSTYKTVHDAIGSMPILNHSIPFKGDPLHKSMQLSDINLKRIRASKPNGSWRDWSDDLRLECHKKDSGKTYTTVYGRMGWEAPSPTITTQFYNYGTGRFGHPEQDRALSLREGALLQTFPESYKFYRDSDRISTHTIGRHIGNAVPVQLGYIIGESILQHLTKMNHEY